MSSHDYCTAVPDKFKDYDMAGCCAIHDDDYANQIGKWKADVAFLE